MTQPESNREQLKYRIHFTLGNGVEDSIVIYGETLEEIRDKANEQLSMRSAQDAWCEELKP